jgi:hypothetical protein
MAKPIFDACAIAGKCVSSFFNTIELTGSGFDVPGLVKPWAVSYEVQERTYRVVLETGSPPIEVLNEGRPRNPAPVGAVKAVVEAGLRVAETRVVSGGEVRRIPGVAEVVMGDGWEPRSSP